MPAALLVTAPDTGLTEMLREAGGLPPALFSTPTQLEGVLEFKRGPMVLVLDESHLALLLKLRRRDVRAVVLVTPQPVPAVFPRPVVAVVERPLVVSRLVAAVRLAMGPFEVGGGAR